MKRLTGVLLALLLVLAVGCAPRQAATPTPQPPEKATPTKAAEKPPAEKPTPTEEAKQPSPTAEVGEPTPTVAVEQPEATGKPIKIGQILWQTGALSIYGKQELRGFQLGLEYATGGTMQVAGRPIEVITRDSEGNPDKAVQAARELIEAEGVEILEGAVSSAVALALAEVAKENQLVYLADPAAAPQVTGENFNPYVFRVGRNSFQDALALAGYLVENAGTTFVQIAPDYAFGHGSAAAFRYAVEQAGGTFVADDIFIPLDTTDFTPYLQQVLDSDAEVLIVTWAGTGFIPLFEQMQELGIPDRMVIGTGFGDNETLPAVYPSAIGSTGLIVYHYTLPKNEVNDWLVQRHKEEYGEPPDLFTASGFATAQALVKALEITGGDTSPEKLIPVLEGMIFDGPKGTYYIRAEDHQALQPMYIVKLTNIDDPEKRFFELVAERTPAQTAPPCLAPNRCP